VLRRLNNEVDMDRSVRPEADIDLIRIRDAANNMCGQAKEWPEFRGLLRVKVRDVEDMTFRLHDEGANRQRTDAMLDQPPFRSVDQTTRKILSTP
jgi:hypothetical protein